MSIQYPSQAQVEARPTAAEATGYLGQAFLWMFAGLLLTAAVTGVVYGNDAVLRQVAKLWLPVVFGLFALVLAIQWAIPRVSPTISLGLFFVYAAALGFVIAVIVHAYELPSVGAAFLSASAMFGAAGLYGVVTKRSLAGLGAMAGMAIWGLFVAIIVNMFLGSNTIGFVISIVGVILFTILTAYDTQRISSGQLVVQTGSVEKAAILGAIHLYLDFINLFLFLLRLLGNRR
ncbi:MAG: Bax inhibitor-1/YccA family protein [Chloroflexi bacterium]|nr:Bax inhibitor-1/YccA family protein [Chloroflexota bacterium]